MNRSRAAEGRLGALDGRAFWGAGVAPESGVSLYNLLRISHTLSYFHAGLRYRLD